MAGLVFPSCASAFSMPCSEKDKLTDVDVLCHRKKASNFSHQKGDRTTSQGIYQESQNWSSERPYRCSFCYLFAPHSLYKLV
jgi:hypothetical protein